MSMITPHKISRRDFLKGSAAGLAMAAIGMAGHPGKAEAEGTEAAEKVDYLALATETVEADVVVVGSGGTGCSAATRAAQLGLKTLILEKQSLTGGTSMCTEGLFASESHWQKEAGVDITTEECFKAAMEYAHWLADGELCNSFFQASAANIDWMESVGVKFKAVGKMGDSFQTWHLYETEEGKISGYKYVQMWKAAAEAQGAEFVMQTKAVQVVMDNGAVAGVVAQNNSGDYVYYKAPVVVMATGGYADSAEYLTEVAGVNPENVVVMGVGSRDGDGIRMAIDAGGKWAYAPGTIMFFGGNLKGIAYGTHLYCATAFQPLLWVNQKGKRFVNEMVSEDNFSFSGNAQKMQKKVFSILTQAQMDSFVENGCIYGCGEYIARGTKLTELWKQYDAQVAAGNEGIYTADTLDELAEKIGVNAEQLKATVERYNGFAETGVDLDFSKNAEYILPLKEEDGPYYAFDLALGIFTTVGGLQVDTEARVLDANDNPIPGLYAGGCDAGGLFGDSYDVGYCAGSQQGWCVHSGKVAAESAAAYLGK